MNSFIKNLSNLSAHEKKEMKLAVMLMIVVVVFLICNILALITNILEVFETEINEVTETSNLLVTVNSSVNFFIYIIFGEKKFSYLSPDGGGSWICPPFKNPIYHYNTYHRHDRGKAILNFGG